MLQRDRATCKQGGRGGLISKLGCKQDGRGGLISKLGCKQDGRGGLISTGWDGATGVSGHVAVITSFPPPPPLPH